MDIFVKNVKNCKIHKYSIVNKFFLCVPWKKRKYESDAEFHKDFENHHPLFFIRFMRAPPPAARAKVLALPLCAEVLALSMSGSASTSAQI